MEFFRHKKCNMKMVDPHKDHPAAGNRVQIGDLPVLKGEIDGYPVVQSYWKPNATELKLLNRGGCIALTVLGEGQPPVKLEVYETELPEIPRPTLINRASDILLGGK